MGEMIARFKPGENVPAFAATAVTAGRFVKVTATKLASFGDYQIGHCGAGEWALGVAERDSAATTEPTHAQERRVNVTRGSIARVTAGAAITAGAAVKSDANGKAIAQGGTGVILGYACQTVAADGDVVEVALVL